MITMMMRLMIRSRNLKRFVRGTFASDPPPPPHLLTGAGGSHLLRLASPSYNSTIPRTAIGPDLSPLCIMINNRHLILSSHRRVVSQAAAASSSSGQRNSGSLNRNPSPGVFQQAQVRRSQSLGAGATAKATPSSAATSNSQRMQFLRSRPLVTSHPLIRRSDHLSCFSGMSPSAVSHSSPLLMQDPTTTQSPFLVTRNKSSMSGGSGTSGSEQHCSNSRIGIWSQRRIRLLLFSFLFAFVPAIMHFTRRRTSSSSSDDKGTLSSNKECVKSRSRSPELDSDSSSGSDNESSDGSAVQVSYQQTHASEVEVLLFKLLPLKLISRIWGWINSVPLPTPVRVRIISWYSRCFECDLSEAGKQDLREYSNLGDFFKRELIPGCRPIESGDIVSPSDGTIVHFGRVDREHVEQVKGVKYSLPAFLGPQSWSKERGSKQDQEYHQKLISRPGNALYHCVIYLAPGDYHRFHSPAEWTVRFRRHFSGKLISIRPTFMSWIEDLFTINERVAYIGKWAYGFFSMTAVGATNVGSVRVYFDEKLKTNRFLSFPGSFKDQKLHAVTKSRGDPFGEFNLGSTIVLIFEAPADFECNVTPGQKIRYGQKLFSSYRNTKG